MAVLLDPLDLDANAVQSVAGMEQDVCRVLVKVQLFRRNQGDAPLFAVLAHDIAGVGYVLTHHLQRSRMTYRTAIPPDSRSPGCSRCARASGRAVQCWAFDLLWYHGRMKTIMVIPDLQIPLHDERFLGKLLAVTEYIEPDVLAFVGDLTDSTEVGRWVKGTAGEYTGKLQEAFDK